MSSLRHRIFALLLGLALLFSPELGLRLFQLAPSWKEVILNSGTPPPGYPYFERKKIRGKTLYQLSAAYLGKTNPVSLEMPKPVNIYRVVVLGDSTAQGYPFSGSVAFARWLQIMLEGQVQFFHPEVLNLGTIGATSLEIKAMLPEMLSLQPDLILIYVGHNELLHDRVHREEKFPPRVLIRLHYALLHSATYRLLFSARLQKQRPQAPDVMVYQEYVEKRLNGQLPEREEPFWKESDLDQARKAFAENIGAIAQLAQNAKVPLCLCTVVSNLRDFAPGGSVHEKKLSPEDKTKFEAFLKQGKVALEQEQTEKALQLFNAAAEIDESYALLRYYRGQAYLKLGNLDLADEEFRASRERDDFPLRAKAWVNETLRAQATQKGIFVVDLEQGFALHAKFHLPGQDLFLDNVHPEVSGHRLIARKILETLLSHQLLHPAVSPATFLSSASAAADQFEKTIPPRFLAESYLSLARVQLHQGRPQLAKALAERGLLLLPGEKQLLNFLERWERDFGAIHSYE